MADRKNLAKIHDETDYYEHQVEGVRWGVRKPSWLLADEMGLGKSLTALTVAAVDFERGQADKILCVVPASLRYNWLEEIERHTHYAATVAIGSPHYRLALYEGFATSGHDILIVGYETLVNDKEWINQIRWDVAIVDEGHYIKSPGSKRSKATRTLNRRRGFILTGSPLLNRPDELWALLNFIDPHRFNNRYQFRNRFCNTPDAPILMADGTMKPLGDIEVGDEVLGWEVPDERLVWYGRKRVPSTSTQLGNGRRVTAPSEVQGIMRRKAEVFEVTLDDGSTFKCTEDHKWLSASHAKGYEWVPFTPHWTGPLKGQKRGLSRVVDVPATLTPAQQREADWLSGLMDGEATWPFVAQYKNANPEIWERIGYALDVLGLPYSSTDKGYTIIGGRNSLVKVLNWMNLSKRSMMESKLIGQFNRRLTRVESWRSLGVQEVVSMQTRTGNYIAWGLASKNCVMGGFKNKEIIGVKNKGELRGIMDEYMLRRLKKDCLDLPDKQVIRLKVDMHPDQEKWYRKMETELILEIPNDPDPLEAENVLTKFLRLKQISGTPACFGLPDVSYKLDKVVEMCQEFTEDEDDGAPVVVWTQFRGVLAATVARLDAVGIPTFVLHGDVKQTERMEIINKWSKTKGTAAPGVLVSMLQIGGIGLNLIAANKAIFIDSLYVPKLNEQAEDRIHRIGASTTQPVQIYYLITRNSVEERIEQILRSKRKLFNELIETDPTWKAKLIAAITTVPQPIAGTV
jgi:SNF2-related domain